MSRATDTEKAQCCSDGFLHRFCLNKPCDGLKTRQAGTAKHLVDLDKAAQGYAIVIRNMALQVSRFTLRAHGPRKSVYWCARGGLGAACRRGAQPIRVRTPHPSPLTPKP